MRKLKFDLGEGGIKGFMIRHVEKFVMFAAVILVAIFFSIGYFVDGLPADKTPVALKDRITQVRSHIAKDTWPIIAASRTPDLRHPERVDEGRTPNEDNSYRLVPLEAPLVRQKTLRTDPKIRPPLKLEVVGQNVSLAYARGREIDTIASEPRAVVAKDPKKKKTSRPSKSKDGSKEKTGSGDLLSGLGGTQPGGPSGDDDEGGSTHSSGDLNLGEERVLTPTQAARLDGFVPTGDAVAKSKFLVAVKAVVPYKMQWEEFANSFQNSNDYNPSRDVPKYYWFYVERAEVPADPKAPLAWTSLKPSEIKALANPDSKSKVRWQGTVPEIAATDFVDDVLTLPIPPVLSGNLKMWALHSDVPEKKVEVVAESDEGSETSYEEGPDGPPPPPDSSKGGSGSGAGSKGAGPGGMIPGGGAGGPGGVGGKQGSSGMSRPGGGGAQPGFPGGGGVAGAGPGGMGLGGMGLGGMGDEGTPDVAIPKYKLIRFFDLRALPGKSYRYRLKVLLLDPNHPYDPKEDPPETTLDHTVLKRVKELNSKDGDKRKVFWVESEWSEPSDVVSVPPSPQLMLASTVTPARETILQVSGMKKELAPKFAEKEPQANIVASIWDDERAVRVATEIADLFRGSMLNVTKSVDVLHPITRQFHTLKDYKFETGSVLLDMRGGEPLPGPKNDKVESFHSPGEFLLIDKNGNLIAGDEFEDTEESRRELFVEDTPPNAEQLNEFYSDLKLPGGAGKVGDKKSGKAGGPSGVGGSKKGRKGDSGAIGPGGIGPPGGIGTGGPGGSGRSSKGGRSK